MNIYFSTLAQKELQEAVDYYDEISSILGDELVQELERAKHLICSYPLAWAKIDKNQRKYSLKRFPYMLIYRIYCDRIVVAAFAHQHRNPDYHINRKSN